MINIGVDFDNTIADYDDLMHELALKNGFISVQISAKKQAIRDYIRSLKDGEIKWQKLQAMAYGKCMFQAKLIEGVRDFFLSCYERGIPIWVVSHKTQYAALDHEKHDLHNAALRWMKDKDFFQEDRIFFEPTRQEKIARIKQLNCTHFIDDLEEVFIDKTFPAGVQKILFAPGRMHQVHSTIDVKGSWKAIYDSIFTNIRK